jgi:DNA polymerase elongation subunit (family B)
MAHLKQTHLISKVRREKTEEAAGAFVLPPQDLGIHREVHVCDFKSLYPTVIRTFNISPESKGVGSQRCTAFGRDIEFDTTSKGMFAAFMEEAMKKRNHWKKIYQNEPDNKYAERLSKAWKILANSGYGVLGSPYFRFFDIDLVESVTLSAKELNHQTATAARARGWRVLYMDTDSLFVSGCSVEEFKEFVQWCNKELYPKLLDDRGVPREQQCIELDYEKCFDRLIFPLGNKGEAAAKRYAGSYLHYGFKPKAKPEIRGLEYMRADSVRYARRLQREVIELLLKADEEDLTEQKLIDWVYDQKKKFFEAEIDVMDIAKSAAISRALDAYKTNSPHVRIAKEMAEEGEDVSEGTRISFITVDGSVSPARVIPTSKYDGKFDRKFYWQKQIFPATMRVLQGALPDVQKKRWQQPAQRALF